jgi:hypothetical protein
MWVTMNQLYPKPDTPESLEGNAAHWVAWEMHDGRICNVADATPYHVPVTDEMLQGAELLVDTMNARMPIATFGNHHVEQKVPGASVHPDCWGTPDAWGFNSGTMTLEVVDYKFGHRFVDEFENDQCVIYACGVLDQIAESIKTHVGAIDQTVRVNITIVQPRCFYRGAPVRTWSVLASDLRGQLNILRSAAAKALAPNPQAVTNSECGDCPGRHACPALQRAGYSDAEFAVTSSPVELSPEAASLELRMLERAYDRLGARVEGMRETVTGYAKRGAQTPWHKLEQTQGRQVWSVPTSQVVALGNMFGIDLAKPTVITPKQAVKSGIDEAVISAYTVTPTGKLNLVPENPADARRVFGNT